MINRELRKAAVITYEDTIDEYGQINQGAYTERETQLTFKVYNHSRVEDVRYNDVTHIALTHDRDITDVNKIKLDGVVYAVQFVNPDGRLVQLYLKED